MREAVRKVPKRRRYAAVAILALFAMAATVTSATARTARPHKGAFKAVIKATDSCGYPFTSAAARTATTFNESSVLKGFSATALGTATATVQEFYSDEWELNLGNAPIEPWNPTYQSPTAGIYADDAGTNPNGLGTGSTGNSGAQPIIGLGDDPQGRPNNPSLYVTDVTGQAGVTASTPQAGDWQKLTDATDAGQNPNFIAGTWKVNGQGTHVFVNGKAQANGKAAGGQPFLGPHADAFDKSLNTSVEGYAAESRWDVSSLKDEAGNAVKPGHKYKVQMMIHDGDHVSDTGEACVLVNIPKAPSTTTTTPKIKVTEEININVGIDATTGAQASVKTGDTVTVRLVKAGTATGGTRGCVPANQAGFTTGTAARRQGSDKLLTIGTNAFVDSQGNVVDANGNTIVLTYPDDFGGSGAPALENGNYWWFVDYSGNDEVDGSNDDCSETFNLNFATG